MELAPDVSVKVTLGASKVAEAQDLMADSSAPKTGSASITDCP